ncbi:hypothetical protein N7468_001668 [Penicillium chermesinum]|uniref:magnesium chelatase n=1 Tax=Penicillium chermesinum TaxID=63820 RepID=A0A9W9TWZ4_9EURO|nr:uncharacterized protein N7468_001668 [Penicillium chermesinum]KAJ5246685.1 hypothetical protein N7468_001668 [Penicillium chermesinum]
MDNSGLEEAAQQLSDLEVALFLSLAAREHCLIETTMESIEDVAKGLALICSESFALSSSIIDCWPTTSIEEVHDDILSVDARKVLSRPANPRMKTESSSMISSYAGRRNGSKSPLPSAIDEPNLVNVVIAKNFNSSNDDLQVQFLQSENQTNYTPPIKSHLNDNLFISHFHDHLSSYTHQEEDDWNSEGEASTSSVIHTPGLTPDISKNIGPKVDQQMIEALRTACETVTTSAEVTRYMQDIVVFLRLSRAVAGGISARANFQFIQLSRMLAPLHGIDYLTPSIVVLAARKVFRHRIVVATPAEDRSIQYGSDIGAVAQVLAEVTPDSILDGVLALEPPV